jgi:hypothetical protein
MGKPEIGYYNERANMELEEQVSWGQTKTFNLVMKPPSTVISPSQTFITSWRMLRENVVWFGEILSDSINVNMIATFQMSCDIDGEIKEICAVYANINGVWKVISDVSGNINGVWKLITEVV